MVKFLITWVRLHDMWGPKLKYRLEVRRRPPGDVAISISESFHGWSPRGFSVVPLSWPASLVVTLPSWGWRGGVMLPPSSTYGL
jgi:hypothetical protein